MTIFAVMFFAIVIAPATASADAWLFEPSVGFDQRLDDNYLLEESADGSLTATRVFAEVSGSREGRTAAYRGQARIDQELVNGDGRAEGADSDRYLELDAVFRAQRLRYGAIFGYRKDTTSRDISSDLTSDDDLASDPGLIVRQSRGLGRDEYTIEPNIEYDLSRRTLLSASLELKQAKHELPYPRDEIYKQYQNARAQDRERGLELEPEIPFDELTFEDVGVTDAGGFATSRDLEDFQEIKFEVGTRFELTETTTLTGKFGYSDFKAEVDADNALFFTREELDIDPRDSRIQRKPTRDSLSNTSTFTLGIEHSLSPITSFGIEGGVYYTQINRRDTRRGDDRLFDNELMEPVRVDQFGELGQQQQNRLDQLNRIAPLTGDDDGWLGNLTFTHDDGVLRYVIKYAVDVRSSSTGSQVEATTLTGDVYRALNPRLEISLRTRAFEPKKIDGGQMSSPDENGDVEPEDDSRRFISIEPRISWNYTRAWTLSAAYRYRRQRTQSEDFSTDSNALLFTLRYTPPSALRAAADSDGF